MEQDAKPVYWTLLFPLLHPWKPASPHRRCLHKQRASILSVGLYNKASQIRCLINKSNLFITVLGAGNLRSRCHHVRFWWGLSTSLQTTDASLNSHMVERTETELFGPFSKAVIPFMRLHPCDPLSSQRPHLFIPSHCMLGFHYESGEKNASLYPKEDILSRYHFISHSS